MKQLYALWLVAFAVGFVSIAVGATGVAPWAMAAMGALFAALGIGVALNLNDAAVAMVEATKEYTAFGADYSKSALASERFIRLFGLGQVIVGVALLLGGLTEIQR